MYNNSRACCFGSSLQRKVCAIRARGGIPPTIIYNIIKERLYMKAFMDKDFLLETPTAQHLYHDYSAKLPIVDYHCHIPPQEIYEDRRFENIAQVWLGGHQVLADGSDYYFGDHYKWRLMRCAGVDEYYITGGASDYEKFCKWAEVVGKAIGNPLYHWTHLELQRYFEIYAPLTPETAPAIWEETKEKLKAYDAVSLLEKMNVRVLCNGTKKSQLTPRSRSAFCRRSGRTTISAAIRTQNAHCAKNTARAACRKRWERHWTISAKTAARSPTTGSADLPTFRAQNRQSCCIS